jgi:hypothetical protein
MASGNPSDAARMFVSEQGKSLDDILAQELSSLSFQDRYKVNLDVKGKNVLAAVEPNELSSLGLKSLSDELEELQKRDTYYKLAVKLGSPMVISNDFRLKFARADCFDPSKASVRMEKYLQFMCESFGTEALTRPITLSDLDKVRFVSFVLDTPRSV